MYILCGKAEVLSSSIAGDNPPILKADTICLCQVMISPKDPDKFEEKTRKFPVFVLCACQVTTSQAAAFSDVILLS